MKKANARLQKALQRFKDKQSKQFEPRRSVANAVITSVERDSVTGHTTGVVRATIDGIPDQNVFVGSGQGFSVGSVVRVENRGGSFAPDWTLIGRVGSVAGAEGTLDIDRTLSTPTGVVLSTDAYTPVAGAGLFSSVTVTFNQNQDYESVAAYDIQWFKDSEGASTAQIISVPHVVGQATNLAVVGGLLPSSISVSQSYSFRVRARAYSGAVGGWTEYSAIETAADPTAPSTPTGLSAVAIDDYTLRLYWTANSEPDFSYYVLDVSANGGTAGRLTGYPRTVGNQNEFILGVTPNVSRYFAVKAVDATGNESSYSSFAGPFKTENLPSDAGLFYFGPTIELVANLTNAALTMDVNFNILEAGWFVHLVAPNGTNEIVQINTSTPGGSAVSNGDGYRYNIVRAQGGTTAQAFSKGTIGHALTTAGFIQSDVREGVSNTPTIRMWEWDDPYTNAWADKTLRVALGNLGGITDPVLGSLSGYGLYSDNVYLTGQIVAQGGAILGSIQIDGGDISAGGISLGDGGIVIDSDDNDWVSWKNGSTNIGAITANVTGTTHKLGIAAFNDTGSETVSTRIEITANQAASYVNILEDDTDVDFKGLRIGLVGGTPSAMLDVRGNISTTGNVLAAGAGQNIGSSGTRWDTIYVNTLNATSIVGSVSGLVIGTNVQAWDADLDAIAALAKTDGNIIVGNGTTWVAESGATARASLGLTIGTHVQAWDADLDAIAALAKTDSNFIVGNGTTWVAESGATARTSIGLGTANSPTFAGLTINGNIAVTGTVDGVDVSAHKSRHESGGADAINHDSLTGFVANEHIDHSTVSITAGTMLTGGGTIASTRTLNVNLDYDPTWTGLHTFTDHTEMDSVDVNGALTVTDDLTVVYGGYYPLFVNVDTVNPNNSNVGIMTNTPDSQFALDVAGALRAEYLVGPHAIQLSDATLICHFDGPTPYTTNFDGSAVGHMGQVPTVSGGVEYHEGKFGKALQIGNTTTNLVANPSFETFTPGTPDNFTGWTEVAGGGTVQSVASEILGSYACRLTYPSAGATNYVSQPIACSSSTQYTLSFYLTVDSGAMYYRVDGNVSGIGGLVPATHISTPGTQRVIVTFTTGASDTSLSLFFVRSGNNVDFTIDAVQIEKRAFATAFVDGSRTGGTLYHDISNIDANEGTIMMWVKQDSINTAGGFLWSAGNANAEFDCYVSSASGGTLYFRQNVTTSTNYNVSALIGEWYHVACTWSVTDNYHALYVNGVLRDSGTYSAADLGSGVYIGKTYSGVSNNHTGLIDDFVLLSRAAPADEIRSIYESNAPVFAESSVFSWRSPSQVPVWVDSEGLWMRSTGGGETLGAYGGGGGGVSKSWGGKDLYQSDFLLGNNTDGYIHWHAYQDDSDPWGAAGMEVKAVVDIIGDSSVSGSLSVAGGDVVLDTDGVHLQGDTDGGIIDFKAGSTVVARIKGVTEFTTQRNLYIDLLPTDNATGAILYIRGHNAAGTNIANVAITEQGVIAPTGGLSTSAQVSTGNLRPGGNLVMQGTGSSNYLTLNRLTTTQRNALSGYLSGTVIYNVTTNKAQVWTGSAWADLH